MQTNTVTLPAGAAILAQFTGISRALHGNSALILFSRLAGSQCLRKRIVIVDGEQSKINHAQMITVDAPTSIDDLKR